MPDINKIIREEIMTTVANFPQFGDRLKSISEVGEGSSVGYPFKFEDTSFNEVNYHFDTEEDEYVVQINNIDPQSRIWSMQFGTVEGTPKDVVNKGRMYNVMATMLQITNDFIDRFKPNGLKIEPTKDEDKENDKQRLQLYMQYVKRNMRKDYLAYEYGDSIIIERKAKIDSNIPKI